VIASPFSPSTVESPDLSNLGSLMTASDSASGVKPAHTVSLSSLLVNFARQFQGERVSIHDIKNSLGRRSFGLMLLVLAIPNSLPIVGIPGVSTVTGLPLLLIAGQMMLGYEHIWLPKWISKRDFSREGFLSLIEKIAPWLNKIERLMKPRWPWLIKGKIEHFLAAVCVLMAFLLILPIPLGNLPPGFSLLLISLGMVEKDGVCVAAGLAMSVFSIFYLQGLIWVGIQTISALLGNWF
jgi:hypothetical protein